jgi:hypothetical protein
VKFVCVYLLPSSQICPQSCFLKNVFTYCWMKQLLEFDFRVDQKCLAASDVAFVSFWYFICNDQYEPEVIRLLFKHFT